MPCIHVQTSREQLGLEDKWAFERSLSVSLHHPLQLLVGFNSDTFEISNIQTKYFMIVCVVHHKNKNISWTFANVYGASQAANKDNFLSELAATCSHCKGPILLGGDFNILRSSDDKNKPYVANRWSFLFNAIIDHHGLIELDLTDKKLRGPITEILPLLKNLTNF